MNRSEVENENLYEESLPEITEPFNPKDVDIIPQTMIISNIMDRLEHGEIILNPDFQRNPELWNVGQQSRLIESLIIKIPLPTFYFDSCEDDKLIVVDGLQRLCAINKFAVLKPGDPNKLRLKGLEYLKEFENHTYEELPINIQRRIREQAITTYVIRPGTPDKVKNSIFTRINTGGVSLTPAEIKNSVYRGKAASFLRELAKTKEFCTATRNKVDPTRMLDCEFVNRFLAFYILGIEGYKGNLEEFLNDVMVQLQKEEEDSLKSYKKNFIDAMVLSCDIFGDKAFRRLNSNGKYGPINKPLFECVSVSFARLMDSDRDKLRRYKTLFLEKYLKLLTEEEFISIITNGTASIDNVTKRYNKIGDIIRGILEYD